MENQSKFSLDYNVN